MNIVITMGVGVFALSILWAVQSVALTLIGEPLAWPLRFTTSRPLIRWTVRVMVHVSWLIILVGTPLALGVHPRAALHQAFPMPPPWRDITVAILIMFLPPWVLYALFIKAGWMRIEPQYSQAIRRGKLFRRFLAPLFIATLEEAVFRGILLEQLLRSFPQTHTYMVIAIIVSSVIFSMVHFIKRHPGKRIWQPAYGLFIVGCLFGLSYVISGRSLWLPIVVHATAIFVTEVMKLYAVQVGPRWLLGYPEYPQSGLIGSLFVLYAAVAIVSLI